MSLALGATMTGQAALLAEAVQRIFVQRASFSSVAAILGALLAVMVRKDACCLMETGSSACTCASAKTEMRAAVLRRLANASVASTLRGQTGGKVSVALDAVDEADSYFSQYMPRMIEAAIIPVLILVIVLRSI